MFLITELKTCTLYTRLTNGSIDICCETLKNLIYIWPDGGPSFFLFRDIEGAYSIVKCVLQNKGDLETNKTFGQMFN